MQAGPSDKEIITQVLQGDQRSFEILVTRYQSFVFTIALRYTKNREDAEEVAQNAFVKASMIPAKCANVIPLSTTMPSI